MAEQPETFFVRFRGRVTGPLSREDLLTQVRSGRISGLHEVSSDGATWKRAIEHPSLAGEEPPQLALSPEPEPPPPPPLPVPTQPIAVPAPPIPQSPPPITPAAPPYLMPVPLAWPPPPERARESNSLAVAGFVCSVIGLFIGILSVLGLILSASALSRTEGRGLAIAGLVIGIIGAVGWLLLLGYYFEWQP